MKIQKIEELKKLAHNIDVRINLFEGFSPKTIKGYKGEVLFWRQIVNIYGLFADCDSVQVKAKRSLIELMKRYSLIELEEYEAIMKFWSDVSELRKWFCHNNDDSLYYSIIRKRKIENYLDKAFVFASNKPKTLEEIQQKDWDVLNYNIDSRFEEYIQIMEKALTVWTESNDKSELIDEWIAIQSGALFSNKELIQNVLIEIANYDRMNQGIINVKSSELANRYYNQLECGGFSEEEIENEIRNHPELKRTNKEIILDSIRNSGLI